MGLTPMMQQYMSVKEKHKDCILFFRLGDFYEMFFEDAKIASRELELTLTGKDCGLDERAPMCGIPYHAASSYIAKLISKGYKVAIGEQLEDPATCKGIVKRDVVKIVTPGTFNDTSFLEDTKNNYIMSIYIDKDDIGISLSDISTGDFKTTEGKIYDSIIQDEISKFNPKEILLKKDTQNSIVKLIKDRFDVVFSMLDESYYEDSENTLNEVFKENFPPLNEWCKKSSSSLLKYIFETQKTLLSNIDSINYYKSVDYLNIDINSRKNLELTESIRDKSKKGTLLWVLDKTCTSMGGRTLRGWVEQPLMNIDNIQDRLNAVEELFTNPSILEDIRRELKNIYDIERIVGKISSKGVNAKELISLKESLKRIPNIKEILSKCNSKLLKEINLDLDTMDDICTLLENSILDNPSISLKDGNIIKNGYNKNIDEFRDVKLHGKEWLANIETREKEETGIKSLKIGYNKNFGYFIEITKSNYNLIPENRYIRKQTLVNAERFITEELKNIEEKILVAEEKLTALEYEVFVEIRSLVESETHRLKRVAKLLSALDCLGSLTLVALENGYSKPNILKDGELKIKEGRHPVVEQMIPSGSFVANDTFLNSSNHQLMLITGPNMAGKSTYMRQVALTVILAQMGSFVPAVSSSIPVCDRIFTRIGASDDLAGGKSTFMVEMSEVSNILRNATNKSLVILDEVGRGTSTYDGLSIAWAVIEHICLEEKLKSKTLFATHYHELTQLEGKISGVVNYSIAVKEFNSEIIFLRKIIKGGADQSYGIEVAKLAGLPLEVINRAKEILSSIEGESTINNTKNMPALKESAISLNDKEESTIKVSEKASSHHDGSSLKKSKIPTTEQLDFSTLIKDEFLKELIKINVLDLKPMEGFLKLHEIIEKAKSLM